ncbi:hypothetical protein CDAR_180141 [Caerostris darwini]|uniref:Uncharacterized protein n=1 Tax=Caerostris darwini TaxID=1538125 RepID=A0AAV4PEM2_9ARAC|nr:hypothetical protein CDAR_180141 [Caerostris darwini]
MDRSHPKPNQCGEVCLQVVMGGCKTEACDSLITFQVHRYTTPCGKAFLPSVAVQAIEVWRVVKRSSSLPSSYLNKGGQDVRVMLPLFAVTVEGSYAKHELKLEEGYITHNDAFFHKDVQ